MNASLVCLAAVLSAASVIDDAGPGDEPHATTVYSLFEPFTTVRGQSPPPGYYELPGAPQTFSNPGATGYDPFLGPPVGAAPFGGRGIGHDPCLVPCPPPQRFGWFHRYEFGFLPAASTSPDLGRFQVTEFDLEWRHVSPLGPAWNFSIAQLFGVRFWEGPRQVPPVVGEPPAGLPGTVYRIGWDLALASNPHAPWGVELGFTPSLNTDFNRSPSRHAWNLDARAILFHRHSQFWTFVLGVEYWDRVNDYLIPHVGVIWTPSEQWRFRLVFPDPQIDFLLGHDHLGIAKWLYLRGEYHIEAYEVELQGHAPNDAFRRREQIELRDVRLLAGLRMDGHPWSLFIEGGWVFGRKAEFRGPTPNFDIDSGFIGRIGLQF